jgi:hypothetical protein
MSISNINFIGNGSGTVAILNFGNRISISGAITISGTIGAFISNSSGIVFIANGISTTITFISVTVTVGVISVTGGIISINSAYLTWSGTPTGVRYVIYAPGGIDTSGMGSSYIPGTVAGSISTSLYT